MSGGHWNGEEFSAVSFLQDFACDTEERFPKLSKLFSNLERAIEFIVREIDYDFSGDSMIPDDENFTNIATIVLQNSVLPKPSDMSLLVAIRLLEEELKELPDNEENRMNKYNVQKQIHCLEKAIDLVHLFQGEKL